MDFWDASMTRNLRAALRCQSHRFTFHLPLISRPLSELQYLFVPGMESPGSNALPLHHVNCRRKKPMGLHAERTPKQAVRLTTS